jgi:hypothetical protein
MNEMSPENIVHSQTTTPSLEESMSVRFDGRELEDFFGNFKPLDITEEILEELGKDFW